MLSAIRVKSYAVIAFQGTFNLLGAKPNISFSFAVKFHVKKAEIEFSCVRKVF